MAETATSAPKRPGSAARPANRPVLFAWLFFGLALAMTAWAWHNLRSHLRQSALTSFESHAGLITDSILQQIEGYRQAMRAAAVLAAEQPDQAAWRAYARQAGLQESLPGLQAIGYARAAGKRLEVVAAAPANAANDPMAGMPLAGAQALPASPAEDLYVLPPQAPRAGGAAQGPDLRLAVPVPPPGAPSSDRQAQAAHPASPAAGYVFASIRPDALLAAAVPDWPRGVSLAMRDATPALAPVSFDTGHAAGGAAPAGLEAFRHESRLTLGSHTLLLTYTATGDFGPVRDIGWVWNLLPAGAALFLLLGAGLLSLARTRNAMRLTTQRLDADLRYNESRLYGIIQSAMEAIITVDERQSIVIFNPMAEKIFRCSAAQAIGTPLDRYIPERFRASHRRHIEQFGETGISERQMGLGRPLWGLRADGEEFPVEASISQTRTPEGKLYTVLLRDVTERRQAQQALQASRNELARLSARIQSVREEEKTHIARELHDDLGQRLTALKMDLSLLEAMLPPDSPPLRRQARTMHELIDSTVGAVRRIAADLRPAMLDDLGLIPAIEWLASEFTARYGIHAEVETSVADPERDRPDGDIAIALFRCVQEALTNVARHARASRVVIRLAHAAGAWRVHVADDGCGTDTAQMAKPKSFGLLGIRERVRLLGGETHISSQPGAGFDLEVIIPESTAHPDEMLQ